MKKTSQNNLANNVKKIFFFFPWVFNPKIETLIVIQIDLLLSQLCIKAVVLILLAKLHHFLWDTSNVAWTVIFLMVSTPAGQLGGRV